MRPGADDGASAPVWQNARPSTSTATRPAFSAIVPATRIAGEGASAGPVMAGAGGGVRSMVTSSAALGADACAPRSARAAIGSWLASASANSKS